ncbi:MAG: hypothetical protein QXX85_05010 [Candidatus Nitrosotenuis sp.]
MEVAIILSSIAGAATAATMNRFPKKGKTHLLGANTQIRAQIETLRIEKDILTKTISRLYSHSGDLTKIQRDKLLSRYQHQLGVILAKIEKLEEASKYPDLGPLGDGLMSLMDQKLSALDKKLVEISSKISVAQIQLEKPKIEKEEPKKVEAKIEKESKPVVVEKPEVVSSESIEEMIKSFAKPSKKLEITTLTEIPATVPPMIIPPVKVAPQIQTPAVQIPTPAQQEAYHKVGETIQPQKPILTEPMDIEKQIRSEPPKLEFRDEPKEVEKKKPKMNIPELVEEDEDDLDSIKREIMKTLSKLEQAEVE